ncbi:selenide, water dikinase SelD [Bacillaceae bacterium]
MRQLPKNIPDPNLLVGLDTSDDAGVYKLSEEIALIQTVDYFTPIVDDPRMFGQIAAANALSDVYAMGGKPLTVLNIVGFPVKKLDMGILADILRGASEKVQEAGAVIAGGHSIDDQEPKFGMAVTGIVHPEKVWTNSGARPGDALILTKPIGVGIQTTAIKKDKLTDEQLERVITVMATLNKTAAEVLQGFEVHACTDVTGFGLLGHAKEMASGAGVGLVIEVRQVPVLPGTRELAEAGFVPGGTKANRQWLREMVEFGSGVDEWTQFILCDAVTSGGLLAALPQEQAEAAVRRLHEAGVEHAAVIGRVVSGHPNRIYVR